MLAKHTTFKTKKRGITLVHRNEKITYQLMIIMNTNQIINKASSFLVYQLEWKFVMLVNTS